MTRFLTGTAIVVLLIGALVLADFVTRNLSQAILKVLP